MSLERFGIGGAGKEPKKSLKKGSKAKKTKELVEEEDLDSDINEDSLIEKNPETSTIVSDRKKNLKCSNAKCGYKRTLFKKNLDEEDYICRKCGGTMKLTK